MAVPVYPNNLQLLSSRPHPACMLALHFQSFHFNYKGKMKKIFSFTSPMTPILMAGLASLNFLVSNKLHFQIISSESFSHFSNSNSQEILSRIVCVLDVVLELEVEVEWVGWLEYLVSSYDPFVYD